LGGVGSRGPSRGPTTARCAVVGPRAPCKTIQLQRSCPGDLLVLPRQMRSRVCAPASGVVPSTSCCPDHKTSLIETNLSPKAQSRADNPLFFVGHGLQNLHCDAYNILLRAPSRLGVALPKKKQQNATSLPPFPPRR